MGIDLEEDLKRKMIELNLISGRRFQSPQTGFIHFNSHSEDRHDTIPLLENLCFALALLRSRLIEQVAEGKSLIEKLLPFEVDGNFPIYLHEYPHCKDRAFGLTLLPVFHWALTDFRIALGEPLASQLELLVCRIISQGYRAHAQRPLSKSLEFRLKSYFESYPSLDWEPMSPQEWAELLISFQMIKRHTPNSSSVDNDSILEEALKRWHPQLCVYLGPQHHERHEPQVTLFDLFLGSYYQRYSRRALENSRVHLLASLIHPFGEDQNKHLSLSIPFQKTHSPHTQYALYWGNPEQLNSCIFNPQKSRCSIDRRENEVEFTIYLSARDVQKNQEEFEVALYLNLNAIEKIFVQEAPATTFQLGDLITCSSQDILLNLEFFLEQGQGSFFGHIYRANRPNQKAMNLKFETFDWQIALRTICRDEECVLRAKIKF